MNNKNKNQRMSVYGNRRAQHLAKKLNIEIKEEKALRNAYSNKYFWKIVDKYIEGEKNIKLLKKAMKEKEKNKTKNQKDYVELLKKEKNIDCFSSFMSKTIRQKFAKEIYKSDIFEKYENPQEIIDALIENYNDSFDDYGNLKKYYNRELGCVERNTTIVYDWLHQRRDDAELDIDYVIKKVGNAKYRHEFTDYDEQRKILGYTDSELKAEYTSGNALI